MGTWKRVFRTEIPWKAEIVKDILENKGIQPILLNKKEFASQLGFCEVHVSADDLLQAIKIIEDEVQFE